MLSVAGISSEGYYLKDALRHIDEYYTGGEAEGRWVGTGPQALGLEGNVVAEDLRALLGGLSPGDGKPMYSAQAAARRSRAGFDLTFSAPKGVSLLALLSGSELREKVIAAHQVAVGEALGYLEAEAAFVRRGKDGLVRLRAEGFIGAAFLHTTSRLGDPQLHTHLVTPNLARGPDGAWSALDARALYRHARTAGFLYQASLRAGLTQSLGISWRPVERGMAEPAGIPQEVLSHFSRRRAEIEDALELSGQRSAAAANVAAHRTRGPKDHDISLEALRASWRARAEGIGFAPERLVGLLQEPRTPELPGLAGEADRLLGPEGLTHRSSTFNRQDVLRSIASSAQDGARVEDLQSLATELLSDPRAVSLQPVKGEEAFTTAELLSAERALVSSAVAAKQSGRAVVPEAVLEAVFEARPGLSVEQTAAVARLVRGGEGLSALVGPAGTGKSFVLEAARAAWEASGHAVVGAALAGRTALALAEATGAPSFTLARLLADAETTGLPRGGVVVVDEAAMAGTRSLGKLWAAAQAAGTKLVLAGDHRQVPEVEAGGAFAALAKALLAPELTENRRQAEGWEKEALAELRAGSPARAVEAYSSHGRVVVTGTAPEARKAMVQAWWEARGDGADAAMFALARSDVEALNRLARALAKDAGDVTGPELEAAGRSFSVGDEVIALRGDRRLGVVNGTRGRVSAVDLAQGSLSFTESSGREVTVPVEYLEAGQLGWGYATTLHKGQGSTVGRAFLLGTEGFYREAGYTGLSRGRESNVAFVVGAAALEADSHLEVGPEQTPLERLAKDLSRSAAKELALAHAYAQSQRSDNAWDGVARRSALAKERNSGLDICEDPY
jgi:conjugative relaxase-like TrwC/TraI family protein